MKSSSVSVVFSGPLRSTLIFWSCSLLSKLTETFCPSGFVAVNESSEMSGAVVSISTQDLNGFPTQSISWRYTNPKTLSCTERHLLAARETNGSTDYGEGGLYTFDDPQGESPPDPDPELSVSTGGATGIGDTDATLAGTLGGLGEADTADVWFEWGPIGSGTLNQTDKQTLSSSGSFSADISGLESGTTYEFVTYAETNLDSTSGGTGSFETDDGFDFCFLTTATAEDTETLDSLRRFRDESMAATPVGRGLVGLYYRISPPIARTLHRHPDSREAALTRSLVDTCASLSDAQAATDSRLRSTAIGAVLTVLYLVGLFVGAGGHLSLHARETLGR